MGISLFLFNHLFPLKYEFTPNISLVEWEIITFKQKHLSKFHEDNMTPERALNFDQWKIFPELLVYNITENNCRLEHFTEFIQTQKRYPNCFGKISILIRGLPALSSQDFSFELNPWRFYSLQNICRCSFS